MVPVKLQIASHLWPIDKPIVYVLCKLAILPSLPPRPYRHAYILVHTHTRVHVRTYDTNVHTIVNAVKYLTGKKHPSIALRVWNGRSDRNRFLAIDFLNPCVKVLLARYIPQECRCGMYSSHSLYHYRFRRGRLVLGFFKVFFFSLSRTQLPTPPLSFL